MPSKEKMSKSKETFKKKSSEPKGQVRSKLSAAAKPLEKAKKSLAKALRDGKSPHPSAKQAVKISVAKKEKPKAEPMTKASSKPAVLDKIQPGSKRGRGRESVNRNRSGAKVTEPAANDPCLENETQVNAEVEVAGKGGRSKSHASEKLGRLAQKWTSLNRKAKDIESAPYSMRGTYEAKTAIHHKVLGWGYILANKNDRLEVLFKDGVRYLISNYR